MVLTVALVLGGCGGEGAGSTISPTPTASVTSGTFALSDSGCGYEGVTQVAAGQLTAKLANQTADRAHFDFWRLLPGHEYAEFTAYINEEGRRLRSAEPEQGHPAFATLVTSTVVNAHGTGLLTTSVEAGRYGMACIRWKLAGEGPLDMYPSETVAVGSS